MDKSTSNIRVNGKSLVVFFVLVYLMSTLFWLLGAVSKQMLPKETSINLPISALMAFCPIIAALILVQRKHGSGGVKKLLERSFDYKRIKKKIWYIPILFLMPVTMILANVFINGKPTVALTYQFPGAMILGSSLLFFIAALAEEVGWSGYVLDPIQNRFGALTAGLILGLVWAIWHVVPFIQTHNSANWIVWQSINLVISRILMVWIYNNTGGSVFATILYHTMYNVSTLLFPNFGFIYDPVVTTIILTAVALIVIFLWGPKTLTDYPYTRSHADAQLVDAISVDRKV